MKRISFFLIIFLLFAGLAYAQNDKELKRTKIKELIEQRKFRFVARTANPFTGSSINLTSSYDLEIDSMKVSAWLPFFGRAYRTTYGDEGGIKFKETAKVMEVALNENKKRYKIDIELSNKMDIYYISLSVSQLGYAELLVNSTFKQPISYYGIIEAIEE